MVISFSRDQVFSPFDSRVKNVKEIRCAFSLDLSKREHHPFLGISKLSRFRQKQNAFTENRTRSGFVEGLDDLLYAI